MTHTVQNKHDPTVTHYITISPYRPMVPYSHTDQESFAYTITTQRGDDVLTLFCKKESGYDTALAALVAAEETIKFWEPSF